jgi:hypothetical protein
MVPKQSILEFYFEAFSEAGNSLRDIVSKALWINNKQLSLNWKRVLLAELLPLLRSPIPALEEGLAAEKLMRIAANYSAIVEKIHAASTLDRLELMDLSFLVMTLLINAETPSRRKVGSEQVNPDELTWDKFESAVSGAEVQSKRKRSSLGIPEGDLLDHGMHFILNRTSIPFIGSDRAIFVDSWDSQQAERTLRPLALLDPEVSGTTERVIVFPMSPEAVLISSSFVRRGYRSAPYVQCSSDETVFGLNLLACYAAGRYIVSDQENPFGQWEAKARSLVSEF